MSDPILRVEALSVRRGGRTIFERVSLAAAGGEIVGLVGPNGCGKSTLLSCVAGVLAPRDGRVRIAGASVWGGRAERQRARAALGYVPEAADRRRSCARASCGRCARRHAAWRCRARS